MFPISLWNEIVFIRGSNAIYACKYNYWTKLYYSTLREASTEVFLHSISDNNDSNKTKNLSQNLEDSVYAQVSKSGDNVYVAWQESVGSQKGDYDIFFIVSRDGGASFSSPINLSNNTGFSEHPQI